MGNGNVLYLLGGLCYTGVHICKSLLSTFKFYIFHCMLILFIKYYKDFEDHLMHVEVFSDKLY